MYYLFAYISIIKKYILARKFCNNIIYPVSINIDCFPFYNYSSI